VGVAAACCCSLVLLQLWPAPGDTALRDWQLGALVVAAAMALAPSHAGLHRALLSLARSRLVLVALGLWMLASELLNFHAFRVNAFDFGVFDWMLESTLRGRFLYSPVYGVNHFGVHQTWWMLPLVPLHWIWRSPVLLLVVNVALLLTAAELLFRLARRIDPDLAPVAVIALLTCPWVARLLRDGFRPESAFPLFMIGAADALHRRRAWAVVGWSVGLCLVKEDAPLYVIAFAGGAALLRRLPRAPAAVLFVAAAAILCLDLEVVRPWQLGQTLPGYTAFWAGYGRTPIEIAATALRHPVQAAADVLGSGWWTVLLPCLLLPLVEPLAVLSMAPGLLMLGLASHPGMRRWEGYYPVPIVAIALVAVLAFAGRGDSRWRRSLAAVALLALPLFWGGYLRVYRPDWTVWPGIVQLRAGAEALPRPLCAQASIFPQLGYLDGLEVLGPECRARPGSHLLLQPALPPWPESAAELHALADRPGARIFPGGFLLVPGDGAQAR
jgi:Predicted membrane protein (DUF2079)